MPEITKITFVEWRKYQAATISAAWKLTDKKSSAFWSLLSAMLMAVVQFREGFKPQNETLVSILNIIGVTVVVLLAQFVFNLLCADALLYKMLETQIAPPLSGAAKELLLEAVKGGGTISRVPGFGGISISINGRQFIESKNSRSSAQWESALDELERASFVKTGGTECRLTAEGYAEADRLSVK